MRLQYNLIEKGRITFMDEKKRNNVKVQIVFSTLIFVVAFFMELYAMINDSQTYVLICGIAVVALLALYFLVNGIMNMAMLDDLKKEEQYDNLYRSEKASYLMMKKRFEELEQEIKSVKSSAAIPVDEIVSVQKGIAKVILNRNEESFESITSSNNSLADQIERLSHQMSEADKLFLEEEKKFSSENIHQMIDKQQEIVLNLKDMELRLSTSIMQSQKMIAEQKALLHQPQVIQQPFMSSVPVQQPAMAPVQEILSDAAVQLNKESGQKLANTEVYENKSEPTIGQSKLEISEPEFEEAELEIPEPELEDSAPALEDVESVFDDIESVPEDAEPTIEENNPVLEDVESVFEDNESILEDVEPALEDNELALEDVEPALEDNELALEDVEPALEDVESVPEEIEVLEPLDEEPVTEMPQDALEQEKAATDSVQNPVSEEKPPMPDLSDPNRPMSPEEIAALLANMTQDVENAESAEKQEEEVPIEKASEESLENQPTIEILNADESEEAPLMEILDDIVPEQLLNEVNDQVVLDTKEEENKMPMPDLSDPNKKLSADEIAALFANMQ